LALMLLCAFVFTPVFAQQTLPKEPLTIAQDAAEHHFSVELAIEEDDRRRGLMFRRSLGADEGMLFLWDEPQAIGMWMKNTLIPLDMLFIDERGVVVHIARNTRPLSLDVISPGRPVSAVLELKGGRAAELGITPGARVVHEAFSDGPPR
jgi:hypothetical protein